MEKIRLLDFKAPWCFPCKNMEPNVHAAMKEFDNIELVEINVDEEPDMAREYKVRSIPFMVLLKGDDVIGTMVGVRPVEEIKKFLAQA
jgi:thioredoxin 1